MRNESIKNRGYIALSMILIISAVVIGVATTVSLLAIGEAQSSLTQFKGEDAWFFVEGCAEDALKEIHDNSSYGGGTISRPEGACRIDTALSSPPSSWNIKVTTNESNPKYQRTVQIQATRGSTITITSWQEI
jgi:hypothetical protein